MSEDYGSTFVVIEDEEGNEIELEHLDTIMYNDCEYMAFIPADTDDDSDELGVIILRVEDDDSDEPELITIEDDDEANTVFELFMSRLEAEDEQE